jgi:hypothetical protein
VRLQPLGHLSGAAVYDRRRRAAQPAFGAPAHCTIVRSLAPRPAIGTSAAKQWRKHIAFVEAPVFCWAEDYRQQYVAKNPERNREIGGTGVGRPIGVDESWAESARPRPILCDRVTFLARLDSRLSRTLSTTGG